MSPFSLFSDWFELAKNAPLVADATAMSLATATKGGAPSCRMVLLKDFDEQGFVFYTNMGSRKSRELKKNPRAALTFFWELGTRAQPKQRQVRIEGGVSLLSDAEADAYYRSRPLESRIGAWASEQSELLESPEVLMKRFRECEAKYGTNPPRPPHWSGWRILPDAFEFWTMGDHRMHTRERFTRDGNSWKKQWLNP